MNKQFDTEDIIADNLMQIPGLYECVEDYKNNIWKKREDLRLKQLQRWINQYSLNLRMNAGKIICQLDL